MIGRRLQKIPMETIAAVLGANPLQVEASARCRVAILPKSLISRHFLIKHAAGHGQS
jgi:hypothetical protein